MNVTITWATVLSAAAVVGAIIALVGYFTRVVKWFQKQDGQDKDIKGLKEEQRILTKGILACLRGLKEQGCNGPVSEGIREIEEHLNQQAHS
nr:MAG TPA: Lipopolysaccharide assembly protein A domain [Caudoviricetes sp.]